MQPVDSRLEKDRFQFAKSNALDQVMLLEASMQDFSYGKHVHEEFSFGVTLSGRQDFFAHGAHYKSHPGNVIVFNPDDVHDGHAGGDDPLHYRMLYIHPDQLTPMLESLDVRHAADFRLPAPLYDNGRFRQHILRLANLVENSVTTSIEYAAALFEFAEFLALSKGIEAPVEMAKKPDAGLMRALDYLRSHDSGDICLDRLSQQAAMSKYHFLRRFKHHFGLTPHQYWLNHRINKARHALAMGMPLDDVVFAFGFNDLSHFNRRFKPIYGMTPHQYQRHLLPS